MKGFTYKESIDRLEKEVKNASGGGGGGGTAASVSYDNTSSGLTAGTVQAAIDEIDGNVDTLSGSVTTLSGDVDILSARGNFGAEAVIGYVGSDPVYRKVIDCGALPNNTTKDINHGISNLKDVYNISGAAHSSTGGLHIPLPGRVSNSAVGANVLILVYDDHITLSTAVDMSNYDSSSVMIIYTKTAPAANTRNKKK